MKSAIDWLAREECEKYVEGVWDWLEGLGSGVSRSDPSTWTGPQWVQSFKGIVNSLEVAHQDFVWRIRKHPLLVQVPCSPLVPEYLQHTWALRILSAFHYMSVAYSVAWIDLFVI